MNDQQANELFAQAIGALKAGQAADAERMLKKLDNSIPSNPGIIYYLAIAASLLGRSEQAIALYDRVIRLHPHFVEAYNNKGLDLRKLGKYEESICVFRKALEIRPDFVEAYQNLGSSLNALKSYEDAIVSFSNALRLRPDYSDALTSIAAALIGLRRYHEAEQALSVAIKRNPLDAKAYCNLGILFTEFKKYPEALSAYNTALAINSGCAETYENLAILHSHLRDHVECIGAYHKALLLDPTSIRLKNSLLNTQMKICDWSDYHSSVGSSFSINSKEPESATPFMLLGLPSSLSAQQICAKSYAKSAVISFPPKSPLQAPSPKIKIAYLSADYYNHATMHLMAQLFELHDRSRFEVIGISYGRSSQDEMRNRVAMAFDQFIETADKSDREIAEMLRGMDVDIAIDLKGHTQDSRLGILAYRPAPVQVHYLGYPGTLGADFIDYLIADSTLIPESHQEYYTEKIIYLPDTYQVNDRSRCIAEVDDARCDHGLPENSFVYCCFNNNWKITPDVFDAWMRILNRVENSVLWLFIDNEEASKNISQQAAIRNISPDRLIFAKKIPIDKHLARHRHADLFLDTFHCNAHTRASDALWAGLPLVTKLGDTFASRVSASLLRAIGLPQLITENIEDYEALAIELASDPDKLSKVKRTLSENRFTAPLFDTPRFARHLEMAYEEIIMRWRQNLPPTHIHISSL